MTDKPSTEPVRRKRKIKGPRFVDPRGEPIMIMGPTGKTRMGWKRHGKVVG